jgi:hypothetical protein
MNGFDKSYNTRIERIVIVGMNEEPVSISSNGKSLVYVTKRPSHGTGYIVTIKNPDFKIGDEFELNFSQ